MGIETFSETVNSLCRRLPFKPFTVALLNGDRFEVDHPKAILVRDGVGVYVAPGGIPVIFDHEGVNQIIGDLMEQKSG